MTSAKAEKTIEDKTGSGATDDALRNFVGYNMKTAYLLLREDLNRTLAPLDLRIATFSALTVVVENPDISQTQLSQVLKLERSGMVVLVDELENAELISRNRVPGDRRTYALRATPKGRKLWNRAREAVEQHERSLFAGVLDQTEQETLKELLYRISTRS
ncbi:MarR family winged helix-turn-helix transcriptional regulator [Martelella limonii]|uniref:MarR family winged helix-turn-helix transcriptional regulator n=1 Tax=Martelella limonii TaxID=1647649 RepID=UPI00157FD36D|nr:MarR family transcriptional regulator [Martelella limonii]